MKHPQAREDLTTLQARHRAFDARPHLGLPARPRFNTAILCCIDARVDPAHVLGLELGDAVVLRNLGGRVDEGVEREVAFLSAMLRKWEGPPLHLVLFQHTDCGLERIASPEVQTQLAAATGIPLETVRALAIHDHGRCTDDDLERLRTSPLVPDAIWVSILRYDVASGALEEVRAPAPLSA